MKEVYIVAIWKGSKCLYTKLIEAFTEIEAMREAETMVKTGQEYSLELYY